MRDWGYGSPEDVAKYANKDSRALSKVTDDDLLDELKARLLESATLPAHELSERISDMLFHYDEVVERRK